jgi:hypothetical protein
MTLQNRALTRTYETNLSLFHKESSAEAALTRYKRLQTASSASSQWINRKSVANNT